MTTPTEEAAFAAAAEIIRRDPVTTGVMGRRIRMLELQLSWALGVLEARVPAIDLTSAYTELYNPGPVIHTKEEAGTAKKGTGSPLPGGSMPVGRKRSSIFDD